MKLDLKYSTVIINNRTTVIFTQTDFLSKSKHTLNQGKHFPVTTSRHFD